MKEAKVGMIDLGNTGMDVGSELYDIWRVKIKLRNVVYGGVPKDPKIIQKWIDEKIKKAIKAGHDITPEIAEEERKRIMETLNLDEDSKWCGFKDIYQGEEVGPYLDGYNFKAMIREGATQTGAMLLRFSNNRGLRQHYQHGMHVKAGDGKSDIIRLGKVDGQEEFVGHVKTPQGEKSILSRHDYVGSRELEFQVWSLAVGILDDELLATILKATQEIGLGACRSRELSKFDLVEMERIQVGKIDHFLKMKAKKGKKDA